jgi:hypothetical protein
MLDYQVLCHAIRDWKAGQRPTTPPVPSATPTEVLELASGMVQVDEAEEIALEDEDPDM